MWKRVRSLKGCIIVKYRCHPGNLYSLKYASLYHPVDQLWDIMRWNSLWSYYRITRKAARFARASEAAPLSWGSIGSAPTKTSYNLDSRPIWPPQKLSRQNLMRNRVNEWVAATSTIKPFLSMHLVIRTGGISTQLKRMASQAALISVSTRFWWWWWQNLEQNKRNILVLYKNPFKKCEDLATLARYISDMQRVSFVSLNVWLFSSVYGNIGPCISVFQ